MTSALDTTRSDASQMSETTEQTWVVLPHEPDTFPLLESALHAEQIHVLHYPVLHTQAVENGAELDTGLQAFCSAGPDDGDPPYLLLASPAAARAVGARLDALNLSEKLPLARTVLLGAATAAAAAHVLPGVAQMRYVDGLETGAARLTEKCPPPSRLLLPVAAQAFEPLTDQLSRAGYGVNSLPAYARFPGQGGDPVGSYLFQGRVDAILFSRPEQLRFFRRRLLAEGGVMNMLDHVAVYCLDAWTTEVAVQLGLKHAKTIEEPLEWPPSHASDSPQTQSQVPQKSVRLHPSRIASIIGNRL